MYSKLTQLSKKDNIRFALFCAKKVHHLIDNSNDKEAVASVEAWLAEPPEGSLSRMARAKSCYHDTFRYDSLACLSYWLTIAAGGTEYDCAIEAIARATYKVALYAVEALNEEIEEENLFNEWLDSHLLGATV
jgi:hypothetical protein